MRGQDFSEGKAFQIEGIEGAKALVWSGGQYDQDVWICHPELLHQITLPLSHQRCLWGLYVIYSVQVWG